MIVLALLGNADKLGHKEADEYITKDKYAVLTGSMTLNANTSENAMKGITTKTDLVLNYPEGFNSENCVVVSAGRQNGNFGSYGYGWNNYIDSMCMMCGIEPFSVSLYGTTTNNYSNKIRIWAGNLSSSEQIVKYKIVLMKID